MDVNDGPISSDDSDISLETQPPSPLVSDSGESPTTNPRPSADIPPDPTPRPPEKKRSYYDGLSLELAQQQAIRRCRTPRYPQYVTSASRTHTYARGLEGEGKPSAECIAAAGFFYDGRSNIKFQTFEFPSITYFIYLMSRLLNFQISRTYLNSNFRISRLFHHG